MSQLTDFVRVNTAKAIVLPNRGVFQVDGDFSIVTDLCDDQADRGGLRDFGELASKCQNSVNTD